MRTIESHKVNPANDVLNITVLDEPGSGGACHVYEISTDDGLMKLLEFQNGPIAEVGVNGITHETLLAILIDRMEGFQSGPYANDYNAEALMHMKEAAATLHSRTKERMARGVEGTHQA